jgi:hypothetical protein
LKVAFHNSSAISYISLAVCAAVAFLELEPFLEEVFHSFLVLSACQ